jgi:hypothetical protein
MAEDSRFQTYLERLTVLRYALAPLCVGVAALLHIAAIGPLPACSQR